MALLGAPLFGKSTLLSLLAYHWADSSFFTGDKKVPFKLCMLYDLPRLEFQSDFPRAIAQALLSQLKGNVSEEELLQTLSSYGEGIILLLDSYDQLQEDSKHVVDRFLQNPHPFSKSKIIVASRNGSGKVIVNMCECSVEIRGIKDLEFKKIRSVIEANRGTLTEQQKLYMASLPPYFLYFITALCKLNPPTANKPQDLNSLLNIAVHIISRHLPPKQFKAFSETSHISNEVLFCNLGRFFYRALIKGYHTFEEDLLRKELNESFDDFMKWNFFYHENNTWKISSKLLMVFFATKYLKKKWKDSSTDEEKQDFLERLYCFGCSGDYVVGQGCVYYVGLLPEIALKLRSGAPPEEATVEMLYNAERIDASNAFDTLNLLLRVKPSLLYRFSFEERSQDDDKLHNMFANVLNNLEFGDFCIEHHFHCNIHENTHFLKIDLKDSNEDIVLNAIFRKNSESLTDRVYLDFSLENLHHVINFVMSVLSNSFKGFKFEVEKFEDDSDKFLVNLISSLLNSQLNFPVSLSCIDNNENFFDQQNSVVFKIFRDRNGNSFKAKYWIQKPGKYNTCEDGIVTKKQIHIIEEKIKNCVKNMPRSKVTVQLL